MRKKVRLATKLAVLLLCFSLVFSGCNNASFSSPEKYADLPDSYVEGADYPYLYRAGASGPFIAPNESGYFFLGGRYIYFVDKETATIQPLCNRPECTHGTDCSSFIPVDYNPLFQYYEGYLYVTAFAADEAGYEKIVLYQISPQDCTRKVVCQMPYGIGDKYYWARMHRGYLYYESGNSTGLKLERVALDKLAEESLTPELLYTQDMLPQSPSFVYGDHYIIFDWEITGDNASEWEAVGWLTDYNMRTGTYSRIPTPNAEEDSYYVPYTAKDDVVYLRCVTDEEYRLALGDPPQHIAQEEYLAYNLEAGTVTDGFVVQNENGLNKYVFYDGKNWLAPNAHDYLTDLDKTDQQGICLLDENFETVKMVSPYSAVEGRFVPGDEDFSFVYYPDDYSTGTVRMDIIDKRDGKFELTTIWEEYYDKANPSSVELPVI